MHATGTHVIKISLSTDAHDFAHHSLDNKHGTAHARNEPPLQPQRPPEMNAHAQFTRAFFVGSLSRTESTH